MLLPQIIYDCSIFITTIFINNFFTLAISHSPIWKPLWIIWMWMNEGMNTASYRQSCTGPNCMKHKTTYIYKIQPVTTRCSWCYAYKRTFSSTTKLKLTATKQDGRTTTNTRCKTTTYFRQATPHVINNRITRRWSSRVVIGSGCGCADHGCHCCCLLVIPVAGYWYRSS
jgi:hypothetical protein